MQQLADDLAKDSDIDVAYLFGSHAMGMATPLSDIDIGILLGEHVPREDYFNRRLYYIGRCTEGLRTDKVDVVILNDAPLLLAYEAVKNRKILVERNSEHRVTFEVDRINRYLDFKPLLDVQVQYVKNQLAQGTYFD